jgi:pimeloyl-ACP methyl ester carboxylesterase
MARVIDFLIRNQQNVPLVVLLAGAGLAHFAVSNDKRRYRSVSIGALVITFIALRASMPSIEKLEFIPHDAYLPLPTPVHTSPTSTQLILFVHGWRGDPEETWQRFPQLVAGDARFSDSADVLAINYPTYIARRNLTIAEVADWINKEGAAENLWSKYKKIAIVAHSMGGLVARDLALLRRGLTPSVTVLVEIATPHQGADPYRVESALGLATFFSWLRITAAYTEEVRPRSPTLIARHTFWQAWSLKDGRPPTRCFTSPQDDIVSQDSARFPCDDWTSYPQGSHTDLVKPESVRDTRFSLPMFEVERLLGVAR